MRSADLMSSPKADLTEQVYLPLSSVFTNGMTIVLIVCTVVMMFEGISLPSLVQVNWTGFVPELNVHTRVASPPTDASETIIPAIFGGTDASNDVKAAKTNKKQ